MSVVSRLGSRNAGLILAVFAVVAAGCSPSSEPAPETTTTVSIVSTTTPTSTTSSIEPAEDPVLDLSKVPFVEFHPISPNPPGSATDLPDGSIDYMDLFDLESPWSGAASHVDLFKLHSWQVRHILSDDELTTIITNLEERGIPMALEMEPLEHPDPSVCAQTESFEGKYDLEMAQKIKDLGGTISVVSLDEPYSHAHKYTGPGSCQYPVDRVVDEVILFVEQLREIFPDVLIGSIEPYGTYAPMDADDIALWLDTYEERSGEPFAFMHIDVEWYVDDWPEVVLSMEDVVEERGIPFGIIYNASEQITTNDEWLASAAENFAIYETEWGGSPDHVTFQSWTPQPDFVLPDDSMTSFTGLINRYFGMRTSIEDFAVVGTEAGPAAAGVIVTGDGSPVADESVALSGEPLVGTTQTVTVTGTVPADTGTAIPIVRVNIEGATPGQADLRLYDVSYSEDAGATNLVPNADFDQGLQWWHVGGANLGDAVVVPNDIGDGSMLLLEADPDQDIQIDGTVFDVTPGATYEFTVTIGYETESFDTGIVSIAFIDDVEIVRTEILFRPHSMEFGITTTDATGRFVYPIENLAAGMYAFKAVSAGAIDHWPAVASLTTEVR